MDEEAKGFMSILIREVQDIIKEHKPRVAVPKIQELMDSWVKANDLRPGKVTTFKMGEDKKWRYLHRLGFTFGSFRALEDIITRTTEDGLEIATLERYYLGRKEIPTFIGRLFAFILLKLRRGTVR